MCVYRSLKHIYTQVIDDAAGNTLAAASTVEKEIASQVQDMTKTQAAQLIGKIIAQRAQEKGIKQVVFDRGGYLYTGRVAAVADERARSGPGVLRGGNYKQCSAITMTPSQLNLKEKLVASTALPRPSRAAATCASAALVVVGDDNGRVGVRHAARPLEVPEAIRKGLDEAKKKMFTIPLDGTTIPHEVTGVFGTGKVKMLPAPEGTGVIAGGPVRAVLEAAGIKNNCDQVHRLQ